MKENPEAFREKEAAGRQQRRTQEMEEDPEAFREKEATGRQERRTQEMEEDPDAFREKESTGHFIGCILTLVNVVLRKC